MRLKCYTCRECGSNNFSYNEKENKICCSYCGRYLKFANKDERNLFKMAQIGLIYADTDSIKIPVPVKIKYHAPIEKIVANEKGDWIDLRAAETFKLKKGEFRIISLGISVQLPPGYEAHIVPRSSTFKKWHIIQTNGVGIIDNSYNGDNDIWGMPVLATEDTVIHIDDRICQFRIVKKQPEIIFQKVDNLGNADRGGFGSTGTN